jgi:hypothetical protein
MLLGGCFRKDPRRRMALLILWLVDKRCTFRQSRMQFAHVLQQIQPL